MKQYILPSFALALSALALTSCDDFLDTMPDNRATLDSTEKIKNILVSAYPDSDYAYLAELSSDNMDDAGPSVSFTTYWLEDTYAWKDEIESDNESAEHFWETSYSGIANANQALLAIEEAGGADASQMLSELKGEALMCRAYNHFMLAQIFCKHWTQNAASDLGLPYMTHAETTLKPEYTRGNLADFYAEIEADLIEGLQRVGDSYYDVPKYHFNQRAAWAFATRYYLYTEQWQKAVDAAGKCLGSQPKSMLRDYLGISLMAQTTDAICNEYINPSSNANLLLVTAYSSLGLTFGDYKTNNRIHHGKYLAQNEDMQAANIWGGPSLIYNGPRVYPGTNIMRTIFWKYPYLMEYTDIVAGIGYYRTVMPILTTDETLLNRAEAYIMLREYDKAAADLTTWMQNFTSSTKVLTPEEITTFYKGKEYCYDDPTGMSSTIKKHLNPSFAIDGEGTTQECMLQCMLGFRRLETMHQGLRWFDIKRYGIEIPRRLLNSAGEPEKKTDFLGKDDLRRAIQIPQKVRDAGLQGNPRKED